MKKTMLSLALAAIAASCTAADDKLQVKIDAKSIGDTVVVVLGESQQTFTGKQGTFDFEVELPGVTTLTIAEPSAFRGDRTARYFWLPAVPGEQVSIKQEADARRYDIDGSTFYAQYHAADLMMETAQKPLMELQEKCQAMMQSGTPQDSVMKYYQAHEAPLTAAYTQSIADYIKTHADQEASAAIITQLQPDLEQMKAAVQLLSPAVREGRCKPLYQNVIDRIEAQKKAEEEAVKLQAPGRVAPDFTLNDLDGKPLSLSSLQGKHVILDFWGSWCGWCIKGFPEMKEYYKKYASKFEILGIDCNDTEQKWKDAVKKHELPWLHVYNPRDSKVLNDYGIQGFPTKIIVGPDGKIVKTIVGEDPAFYTLLDQLFGQN